MYYTYSYLREDGTPYYIGKGKNSRAYCSQRTIPKPKDKDRILILKQNLTEEEAFKHEKYMIAILGRIDLGTGILRNLTDGGEGCSGRIHSEETKLKMKGRKHSEESRKKMSESQRGKTLSEEHRKKLSESGAGRIFTDETKAKISNATRGRKKTEEHKKKLSNVNMRKLHSEESKRKMSDIKKGKTNSEETRKKISEAQRGERHHMFGKNHSEKTKRKISESLRIKWKCTITGHISTSGPLTLYQKNRGIDTVNRIII